MTWEVKDSKMLSHNKRQMPIISLYFHPFAFPEVSSLSQGQAGHTNEETPVVGMMAIWRPTLCPKAAAADVFQPRGNVGAVCPELLIFLNEKLEVWFLL